MNSGDESDDLIAYQVRRRLAGIMGRTELLLEGELGPLAAEQQRALEQIERDGYELTATLDAEPAAAASGVAAATDPSTTGAREEPAEGPVDHLLVASNRPPFLEALERETAPAGAEVTVVTTVTDALAAVETNDVDRLLVDVLFDDRFGLDVVDRLASDADLDVPFGLLSTVHVASEPPRVGVSAVVSTDVGHEGLGAALEFAAGTSAAETGRTVGLLGGDAVSPLRPALERWCSQVVSVDGWFEHDSADSECGPLELGSEAIDIVVTDFESFRQLEPADIDALRRRDGVSRPLVLAASTAADPVDREWIPLLGAPQDPRPVDPVGLIGDALASHGHERRWGHGSDEAIPTAPGDRR